MSLIVLNSKGSDPEDFSNYMTENIEFPANAEVCLVGSHINRKLMIEKEVQFSNQGNALHFQYGHGGTYLAGRTYTAHSPYTYNFHNKAGIFPMKFKGTAEITASANAYLNDPAFTPISPLVGGWACTVPVGTDLFEIHNTQRIPDRAQSEGNSTVSDFAFVPGGTNMNKGGNNVTELLKNSDGSILEFLPGQPWVSCKSTSKALSNFVDTKPLFNTDTGQRIATFAPLPSNTGITGGGWHWQFNIAVAEVETIVGLRGGIIASGGELINPNKGDELNGINSNLNRLSNNTDFCCWWQIDRFAPATGVMTVGLYKRPITPANALTPNQMVGAIKWGEIAMPASAESVRIGMRPVNTGGGDYCIEGYGANVTTATNVLIGGAAAFIPATNGGAAGICEITDPADTTIADADKFDLYRHLPIYQGCTISNDDGVLDIVMNAIHHGLHDGLMSAGNQAAALPYTFGFQPLTYLDQLAEKFDSDNYQGIKKANIGYALGYSSSYLRVTATNMLPASAGVVAEIPINSTIPIAHSLVVSLPDLPISGFFGNSTGTASAGTLAINSGGTSAAIIGVIPFGEAPLRESNSIGWQNGDAGMALACRGSWYSSPLENWIKLKNPHAFKVSSLRVRLTNELGTKPDICAGNTTITIKIKAPRRGDVDRGLTIQGN